MPLWESIKQLDRKFAWSFLGVMLALGFGLVGIYTSFFQEHKPNLKFEVISNTSVLDVHERLGNLDVLYAGSSIKNTGQTLRVITLRVVNDGQQDILKGFYDENDPLGFVLIDGEIVESPELLHASNDYLAKQLKMTFDAPKNVLFSNVIIERNEFFTLKLLVLNNEGVIPDVSPIGKIAGVKSIEVARPYRERNEESFLSRTFGGWVLSQLARLFAYGLAFLILMIAGIVSLISISEWAEKRSRRKHIAKYKKISTINLNQDDEYIFQSYLVRGEDYLISIEKLISDERALELEMHRVERTRRRRSHRDDESKMRAATVTASIDSPARDAGRDIIFFPTIATRRQLVESGFVKQTPEGFQVNEHMRETLSDFMKFLRNKGVIEAEKKD